LGLLGKMTHEWKLFINFCPKSAYQPRFTYHGQIWWKSAVAKLPKSRLLLLTKKPSIRDTSEPPISPIAPKISSTLSALELCMYTDFGPDWLLFAWLISERVQKSQYNNRLSAYN